MIARNDDGANFSTDKSTFRAAERWDQNVVPGAAAAGITKITGIVAA